MFEVLPVIVGIDHWTDITGPFLNSIRCYHPDAPVVVVDNRSDEHYPSRANAITLRTPCRLGYAAAMNYAVRWSPISKWYVFFNNDCRCDGPFIEQVKVLKRNTIYGSGENHDPVTEMSLQWSAWMVVSRYAWKTVGAFDEALDAGFEDFDYQLRALSYGMTIATAELPIEHLDKHTRFKEADYKERWNKCRMYFEHKHSYKTELWPTLPVVIK